MAAKRTVSPITRQQRKRNSEVPSKVRIPKIVPEVPRDEAERAELLEDLQVMGCSGQGCHADVFRRTDGRSDDGRGGVRDLDAL
jgi:hypothetical protein